MESQQQLPLPQPPTHTRGVVPLPLSHSLVVVFLNEVGQFGAVLLHLQEADSEGVPLGSDQVPGIVQVLQLSLHCEPGVEPVGGERS